MSITVTCDCGRSFETPESNAGRLGWCPDCGREFIVPGPSPRPKADVIPWEAEPSVTSGKAVASLVLGALFFFVCFSAVPAIILGWTALNDIRMSKGRLKGRLLAIGGITFGMIGSLLTVALIIPAREAREAPRRAQCLSNLKQIGLAFYNYSDANSRMLPAAITNKGGRPLLSWRVAILPYLESGSLYARFHLDEPWDSPHNLSLLGEMPGIYSCPSDFSLKPGMTGYQVVIGDDTAFTPDFKPVPILDFIDGLNNTILVGESRHSVPWTKPEDLSLDMSVPLTGLGSHHDHQKDGFNVLFGDGSVRFLENSIAPTQLKSLLIRNTAQMNEPDSF